MAESDYNFRYFREPHRFSSYSSMPQACQICGLTLPGYEGPFYGEGDIDFVCEPCLVGGRLGEKGLSTNSAPGLAAEPTGLLSSWEQYQFLEAVKQRAEDLEQRTPPILTWQDLLWLSHCGDYCCYLGEVGQADLDALAPDGRGQEFFAEHLSETYGSDAEYLREIWDGIQPRKASGKALAWSQGVYLFQCLACDRYIIEWDCD